MSSNPIKSHSTNVERKLKKLQDLLVEQSADVSRIVRDRRPYSRDEVIVQSEKGIEIFPDAYRESRPETEHSRRNKERHTKFREEWLASRPDLPPGMWSDRYENPFIITQFPNFSLRGNRWTDAINEELDKLDSPLPRAPYVALFVGAINAGKTTVMSNWITLMAHTGFQNILYVTPMGILDPTVPSLQASMPPRDAPHNCNFELYDSIPVDRIEDFVTKVKSQNSAAVNAALVGRYKESPTGHNLALSHLLLPPGLKTPNHDVSGNPLTHRGSLPNNLLVRPKSHQLLDKMSARSKELPFESKDDRDIGYGLLPKDVSYNSQAWVPAVSTFYGIPKSSELVIPDLITSTDKANFSAYDNDLMTYWHAMNPYKETLSMDQSNFKAGHAHSGLFKDNLYNNALLVVNDANQIFASRAQKRVLKLFVTEIRHRHMCMMIDVQKATMVSRDVWAQTSAVCIWETKEETQLKRLEEDYGKIPNFRKVLAYCTTPDPENGMDYPFMYINLQTVPPTVMKCFTEQIKWDANVPEYPKHDTLSSRQEQASLHNASPSVKRVKRPLKRL